MEEWYKILIIGLILITLTCIDKLEHFYNSGDLLTNQVRDQFVTTNERNDIDKVQWNQGLIFDVCMERFRENNDARRVLLLDEDDIYPLSELKIQIAEIETHLNNKLDAEKNELCTDFRTSYCLDDTMTFNNNPVLYSIPVDEFNNKMNLCYPICYTYDIQEIRSLKKLLYNTLFDILLRYNVLQKIDGTITDSQNVKRYEYLINYNENDAIDIDVNLSIFSNTADQHKKFVKELHRFMRIVVLNIEKIKVNHVIYEDKRKAIEHNFTIQKYTTN